MKRYHLLMIGIMALEAPRPLSLNGGMMALEAPRPLLGRDDWIRTSDFVVPNDARYRAALHPEDVGIFS